MWSCANLECRSEMCCTRLALEMQDPKIAKNWPPGHHRTTLSSYRPIFAIKACIGNPKKKLAKQQYLPHMSSRLVNFGPLAAKIGSLAWGIPGKLNFNGFRVLAALYCIWHCSSGRQPNFAALNRGRHLYLAGWPSRWALAHIVVFFSFFITFYGRPA